jgi:hypothetical protein
LIGRPEVERALTGAWRLFLDKPDALRFFDTGVDGFWRSFQAIVLVAPCYAVAALADRAAYAGAIDAGTFDEFGFWATKAVSLVVDWVTLPILLAALAGFIGIRRGYVAYITVRNWATVLMTLPFAAIALIQVLGVSEDVLFIPSLAALAFSLRFGYLIARRTLGVGMDVAIALVVLDWLVSLTVVMVIGRLTGYGIAG